MRSAAISAPAGKAGGGVVSDLVEFLGAAFDVVVLTVPKTLLAMGRALWAFLLAWGLLVLVAGGLAWATWSWSADHRDATRDVEFFWRCTVQPLFLRPLVNATEEAMDPFEKGVCTYNALAFSTRVLSLDSVAKALVQSANKVSNLDPLLSVLQALMRSVFALVRWLPAFPTGKLPVVNIFDAVEGVLEAVVRTLTALCEDLHPAYLYVVRLAIHPSIVCAADAFTNAAVAQAQYYLTFAYELIKMSLDLLYVGLVGSFSDFLTAFQSSLTDVSPLAAAPWERAADGSVHVARWFDGSVQALICTVVVEIELHKNDNVTGAVPHTSIPLAKGERMIDEPRYDACMARNGTYALPMFEWLGFMTAAAQRLYRAVYGQLFPAALPRIAFEFVLGVINLFDQNLPTSADGASTRFLLSAWTVDAAWDTIRRPLPAYSVSQLERWPNAALYGRRAADHEPPNTTTVECNSTAPVPQTNLFCVDCVIPRTDNAVDVLARLADRIDALLVPVLQRRLVRPILAEGVGGFIRVVVAIIKSVVDVPRHFAAGPDEFLLFLRRRAAVDAVFDELAGPAFELGGLLKAPVSFFAAVHPPLHVLPKLVVLPMKVGLEAARNVFVLPAQVLNSLAGQVNGSLGAFYCLDANGACMSPEQQFFSYLRSPRLSVLPVANYSQVLGGDVAYNTSTLAPDAYGWLECVRYLLSPRFINAFIAPGEPTIQFPDITCGVYYGGRAVVEVSRASYEFVVALLQTIMTAAMGGDPVQSPMILRWLACTSASTCIPLVDVMSDMTDFVDCPCRLLGPELLNVPCACNITTSGGLIVVEVLRGSLGIQLTASQLLTCLTIPPNSTASRAACFDVVFDRTVDVVVQVEAALARSGETFSGIGCLVGTVLELGDENRMCSGQPLKTRTASLWGQLFDVVTAVLDAMLDLSKRLIRTIQNATNGGGGPPDTTTVSQFVGALFDRIQTPLVGTLQTTTSPGAVQNLGIIIGCIARGNASDTTATTTLVNCTGFQCVGSVFVQLGDFVRKIWGNIRNVIIGTIELGEGLLGFVGGDPNALTDVINALVKIFVDGIIAGLRTIVTTLMRLVLETFGVILDGIFDIQQGAPFTFRGLFLQISNAVDSFITFLELFFKGALPAKRTVFDYHSQVPTSPAADDRDEMLRELSHHWSAHDSESSVCSSVLLAALTRANATHSSVDSAALELPLTDRALLGVCYTVSLLPTIWNARVVASVPQLPSLPVTLFDGTDPKGAAWFAQGLAMTALRPFAVALADEQERMTISSTVAHTAFHPEIVRWQQRVANASNASAESVRVSQWLSHPSESVMAGGEILRATLSLMHPARWSALSSNVTVVSVEPLRSHFSFMVQLFRKHFDAFAVREMQAARVRFARQADVVSAAMLESDSLLRGVESYQLLAQERMPGLLPELPSRVVASVAAVRREQHLVPVGETAGLRVAGVLNGSLCANATRCLRCMIVDNVLTEIEALWSFCAQRLDGNASVLRVIRTPSLAAQTAYTLVDPDAPSVFQWLAAPINAIWAFVSSDNMDPWTVSERPLGLWFYVRRFAPVPFVASCDRDVHTLCQFGFGIRAGFVTLLVVTLAFFGLWLIVPPVAGMAVTSVAVLGYVLVAFTLTMTIGWGYSPMCALTPSISIVSVVLPVLPPPIPECVVRDLHDMFASAAEACGDFWSSLTGSTDCPDCPKYMTLPDCDAVLGRPAWNDLLGHLVFQTVPDPHAANIEQQHACVQLLAPSLLWLVAVAFGAVLLLVPLLFAASAVWAAAFYRCRGLRVWNYCGANSA